jgi:hypothetical protein
MRGRQAAQAPRQRRGSLLAIAALAYLDRRPMYPYEVARSLRQQIVPQGLRVSDGSRAQDPPICAAGWCGTRLPVMAADQAVLWAFASAQR